MLEYHRGNRRSKRKTRRLFIEPLEDRRLLATFTVNSTGNEGDSFPGDGICDTANNPDADPAIPPSGICTLRAAADQAANDPSNDRIHFNIDVPEGVIPVIDRSFGAGNGTLEVDGSTQPGVGMVEITDSNIILADAGGHTVKGLVLTNTGITIASNNNIVVGNIIGLDTTGAPQGDSIGISIFGSGNRIGGTTPAERNVISGHSTGIQIRSASELEANNNIIIGNFIGTNVDGTTADPDGTPNSGDETGNTRGIDIRSGVGNRIGGPTEAERNVISGNDQAGIDVNGRVGGVTIDNTTIQGNLIGTDVTGTVALGNGTRGVEASSATNISVFDNVISANFTGIHFGSDVTDSTIKGNKIGTDITGNVIDPDGTPGSGDELGNQEDGVFLNPFFLDTVNTKNTIGGPDPSDANIISGNGIGVRLFNGADENTIQGNLIGTNANGTTALPNGKGIEILFSSKNVIEGNTISGNTTGIEIGGSTGTDNLVVNNRIGLNAQIGGSPPAEAPLPNTVGVLINDSPSNCIGGPFPLIEGAASLCAIPTASTPIAGNVISGNTEFGVHIVNANAANNVVQANKIGTDSTGTIADPDGTADTGDELGNGFDGVFLGVGSHDNIIGGTLPSRRNIISGNLGDGVLISGASGNAATANLVIGNFIGTNIDGDKPLPNLFRGVHIDLHSTENIIGGGGMQKNVISANGADGIIIFGGTATDNVIKENLIGTDLTGTTANPDGVQNSGDELGNRENGIYILEAKDNIIGQADSPTGFFRNTISGNAYGIRIEGAGSTGNVIEGNRIGTDVNGTKEIENNKDGIFILNAPMNRIGTSTTLVPTNPSFPGNVISGNDDSGIRIEGAMAESNFIGGNLIGTAANGVDQLGNNHGIEIIDTPKTRIGFSLPGEPPLSGNTISDNFNGIRLDQPEVQETLIGGNFIGTDFEGNTSSTPLFLGNSGPGINIRHGSNNYIGGFIDDGTGEIIRIPMNVIGGNFRGIQITEDAAISNRIQRNSIFDSRQLGIDLGGDGITANDDLDNDGSEPAPNLPNTLQNFPILDDQIKEDGTISGTLNSTPSTEFTIDFYLSESENSSGFVEGEEWIGEITETTDGDGIVFFEFQIPRALLAVRDKITATATDPNGNTSEFSAPLRLADLRVTLDDVKVEDIVRRGSEFFLPYKATVSNHGSFMAENAVVRIEGNGELVTTAPHVVTLAQCPNPPMCPIEEFEGEWNITNLFPKGVLGMPITLDLVVKADPDNLIPELHEDDNETLPMPFVADPRPRIDLVETEYEFGGFHLNGVSLMNKFNLTVDWNGNLDDTQIGLDQQPALTVLVNGREKDSHQVTDFSEMNQLEIDLGNDLARGPNIVHFRADTNLHFLFSEFTDPQQFQLGDTVDWINTTFWTVSKKEPSDAYNNTAEYKAGFRFPQFATEGLVGVPADKVGFAGGNFGPKIPAATLRAKLYSDKTGSIEGELKWEGQVGGKVVGGGAGVGGTAEISAEGGFKVIGNDLELDELNINVEVGAFITTPKIPFPPPASFIRAQGKLGLNVGATVEVVEQENGELDWFDEAILTLQPSLEAIFSIGEDGIASVEVGIGGTMRGEYDLDGDPCLDRSVTVDPFARLKATFLGFEAQKTFTFTFASTGCGAGGEGESLIIDPRVFTEIGLSPRFVMDTTGAEAESASTGLPTIDYPYSKPALARNDDGTMTLVYVSEDPTKPDGQHLELFASQYDGSEWSAPVQLTDDTLLDDFPSVAYDSTGQAIATWTRLKTPIADPTNTDPTTLLGEFEIVYAVFDPTTDSWSEPVALTDDAEMDLLPRLQADASGNVTAMWLRDADNDTPVFPDDPAPLGAEYAFASWDGTSWSTPAPVTTVSTNRVPQFAMGDGNGLLVWSEDIDGDATIDTDREIRASIWDGTSWAEPTVLAGASDGLADVTPRVAFDSLGRGNVIWVKAGVPLSEAENDAADQLYFTEFVDGSFSTPAIVLETEGIAEPNLIIDDDDNPIVIWQGLSETGPDIFFITLDRTSGAWSEPIQFTDSDSLEWWVNPFINDDGELEIIYLERDVGSEPLPPDDTGGGEGESGDMLVPVLTTSGLTTSARPLGNDLSVTQIELSDSNPAPGSAVQLTATILNSGTVTTPAAELAFFDDGTMIGLIESIPVLDAGEVTTITIDWTVPEGVLSPHTLSAQVDPNDQLVEIDEANNERSLTALKPDLVMSAVSSIDSHTITVTATISNFGASPTTGPFNVDLRQGNARSGVILGTQTVSDLLAPGESTTLTFTISNALASLGGFHTGFVVADSDAAIEEADETNNNDFTALDPLVTFVAGLPSDTGPFRVRRDDADIVVTQQDASELIREQLAAISALTLPATAGDDQITIDFSAGDPIPAGGLVFNGADGNDTLLLNRGTTSNITFRGGTGHNALMLMGEEIDVDLTDPTQSLVTDLDEIDIRGSGNNTIKLNVQTVKDISNAAEELRVFANLGDSVDKGNGWTLADIRVVDNDFFHVLEQSGATLLLAGPADWNNPIEALDVNNSGSIEPLDVLIVINELNDPQFIGQNSALPDPFELNTDSDLTNDVTLSNVFFLDTNGDGFVSALDALLTINFLNESQVSSEGEGVIIAGKDDATEARDYKPAIRSIRNPVPVVPLKLDKSAWNRLTFEHEAVSRDEAIAAIDTLAASDELLDLGLDASF